MKEISDITRRFLAAHQDKQVDVIIKNGYQVHCRLIGWDRWSLLVEVDGAEQLVLLDAVSTIAQRR